MNNVEELFHKLEQEFRITLTSQQQEIVRTTDCPLCTIAAPGSGKTLAYVVRIANLILIEGIKPEQILTLTFSRASAKDMEDRFLRLFGDLVEGQVHFSTIHSFALQVVFQYQQKTGEQYTVLEGKETPENKFKVLKDIYQTINLTMPTEEKVEELVNAIGFVKNMMLKPTNVAELRKYRFDVENFISIYQEYESFKEQNHYIDYDDMLAKALEILQTDSDILQEYRQKYTHIQLDEGQDTSKIQHEIVKLLAHPDNHIFLVGDDDQSIYRFRAAFPEELLHFDQSYANAKILFMEENFRSSQDIVEVASKFIENNRIRYKKNIFTRNPKDKPVAIIRLKDDKEQIRYLIRQLKGVDDLSETAILYRNNISAISIVEHLEKEGIPFYIRDFKKSFFTHWVVQDILAFLDLAFDDTDFDAFSRVYSKGLYVSNQMLKYVQKGNPDVSVFDRLIDFPYFKQGFQKDNMIRLKWDFQALAKKSPMKAIAFIEDDLGYKRYLQNSAKNTGVSYENAKGVLANLRLIAEGCHTISSFKERLVYLENLMEEARFNKNKNAVVLSTIHSSKGLEWDNVFLVDLIQGQFPTLSSIEKFRDGDPRELEEERRLFYVGITRARKGLELMTINLKNNEKVEASLFVKEVDKIIRPDSIGNILAVLNQKKQPAAPKKNMPKVENKKEEDKDKTSSSPQSKASPFQVNTCVNHKKYGKGKIIALNGDDMTIEFENGLFKQFRLNICVEKNIITLVS